MTALSSSSLSTSVATTVFYAPTPSSNTVIQELRNNAESFTKDFADMVSKQRSTEDKIVFLSASVSLFHLYALKCKTACVKMNIEQIATFKKECLAIAKLFQEAVLKGETQLSGSTSLQPIEREQMKMITHKAATVVTFFNPTPPTTTTATTDDKSIEEVIQILSTADFT